MKRASRLGAERCDPLVSGSLWAQSRPRRARRARREAGRELAAGRGPGREDPVAPAATLADGVKPRRCAGRGILKRPFSERLVDQNAQTLLESEMRAAARTRPGRICEVALAAGPPRAPGTERERKPSVAGTKGATPPSSEVALAPGRSSGAGVSQE